MAVRLLGRADYEPVWRAMQDFTRERGPATDDELWFVEHPPVYTLGLAGRPEHVKDPGDTPVVRIDRGGQVTWHGPGQLVAYALVDLHRARYGVKSLVERLEQSAIDLCAGYGIAAVRREGMPGVYDEAGAKLAAIGLRISRGCSYHGIALNVDADLAAFARIDPCGYPGLAAARLSDRGVRDSMDRVRERWTPHLIDRLAPA
jgi:lipoyl(octanoyl) transferase